MNGTHRRDGVWIATSGIAALRRLRDVAPALLAHLGLEAPRVDDSPPPQPVAYSADEEARVAARLRKLGYLE